MTLLADLEIIENDFSYVADILQISNNNLEKLVSGDGQQYTQFDDAEMKDIERKYLFSNLSMESEKLSSINDYPNTNKQFNYLKGLSDEEVVVFRIPIRV